jgi:hypothetical protein
MIGPPPPEDPTAVTDKDLHDIIVVPPAGGIQRIPIDRTTRKYDVGLEELCRKKGETFDLELEDDGGRKARVIAGPTQKFGPAFAIAPTRPEPSAQNGTCIIINQRNVAASNTWTAARLNNEPPPPPKADVPAGGAGAVDAKARADAEAKAKKDLATKVAAAKKRVDAEVASAEAKVNGDAKADAAKAEAEAAAKAAQDKLLNSGYRARLPGQFKEDAFEILLAGPMGRVYYVYKDKNAQPQVVEVQDLSRETEIWYQLRNGLVAGTAPYEGEGGRVMPLVNVTSLMTSGGK